MDVYDLTRKKRPAHPSMGSVTTTPSITNSITTTTTSIANSPTTSKLLNNNNTLRNPATPRSTVNSQRTSKTASQVATPERSPHLHPKSNLVEVFKPNGIEKNSNENFTSPTSTTSTTIATTPPTTRTIAKGPPPVSVPTKPTFVTGPPTRQHWKPDSDADSCSLCHQPFGMIVRRHHCRRYVLYIALCIHISIYTYSF